MIVAALSLAVHTPAWAQGADEWSFVLSPQVWISHIAKNGFAAPPNGTVLGATALRLPPSNEITTDIIQSDQSPINVFNPQWGIQLAAQKGRLTLAGAFQYVSFETRNQLTYVGPLLTEGALCGPALNTECVKPGQQLAQETIDSTRMDVDLYASYFFPDVVKDWVDASLGLGFKFIYASASRQYSDMQATASAVNAFSGGLYTICHKDDCSDISAEGRVQEKSQIYGLTFPMNATLRLSNDGRWLLPFSITPLIGAEVRNDENVVYSATPNASSPVGIQANRLDGTAFAVGVTSDLGVRWIINEMFSAYASMRVQYINGHDTYLAYGPLVGMSVRFGGK